MDPQLLRLYADELTHLREVGAEFARDFPKIAARLGMEGLDVSDPYVERLLEGFAFLAARVQLKLESEHPRLIGHLLESIYPNFLSPVPSMMVVRLDADLNDPHLLAGRTVPGSSGIHAEVARGQDTRCEFRTAHAVTLWPIEIASVQYFSYASDLPSMQLPQANGAKGGLRIRLRCRGGAMFDQLQALDRLAFYISAPDDSAHRLHELVLSAVMGSFVHAPDLSPMPQWRNAVSVQPLGFGPDEALLPELHRGFSGHRLLQEFAALPQRLLFFEIRDLAARLARVQADEVELMLLFSRGEPALEALVDRDSLALFCTPAINLFRKRLDRIQLGPGAWEYHVVADRARPMDFEVHSLESVVGFGAGNAGRQEFVPLYSSVHHEGTPTSGYYTARREHRLLSARQKQQGARSGYVGEEVFLSLVDPRHAPYREDMRQLSVSAWVTNRDLPILLPQADDSRLALWRLESPGLVTRVITMCGPTRPVSRQPVGELGWSLVSMLTQRQLPLANDDPEQAAAMLRRLLLLHGPPEDAAWRRVVDGVRLMRARTVVRRLPYGGRLTFGSGTEIALDVDELAFQGSSAFMFGSVLEHYFARYASINTFTQLALGSTRRGELMRWPPRMASDGAL
ncbi:MAG TPA: type VI secretion system baseplate subunit TssF [Burkholderiaceae bacterium]|nr:type VI secretion system baseplate subunit TssF [Burkholderiaceae bacterium]